MNGDGPAQGDGLTQSLEKLRADGAGEAAVATFRSFARRLACGESGLLREDEIEPVGTLPDAEGLPEPDAEAAAALLDATIVLKLNGGLGTSMGMTRAKALLDVKEGLSFLDVIARQVRDLRRRHGERPRLPLVLLDSFHTREDSLAALARYGPLSADLPADVVQNRFPKLRDDGSLAPVAWPADPELEWAPPGHGDLYAVLQSSGLLDAALERGYRWLFASNADNLGATLDPRILAFLAGERISFLMEVAERTAADRKGGHLARRAGGGALVLREVAQTAPQDMEAFQDVARHRYFNTNSIWLDLRALAGLLGERGGVLGLPMIVNRKTVDPTDAGSSPVIQLESAMGAAIDVFEGAGALGVPRTRFLPVKTTDDLLVLRSDAYALIDDCRLELDPRRGGVAPLVRLDADRYRLLADFESRFPAGPPSLLECERLTVRGDVRFGGGVVVRGAVTIDHEGPGQLVIPDGTPLQG